MKLTNRRRSYAGACSIIAISLATPAWSQTAPPLRPSPTAPDDHTTPAEQLGADKQVTGEKQATTAEQTGLGEIVVTANRRAENLQRVPATIAAITGNDLQARGIVSASDLGGSLPNVRVSSPFSQTQPNFTIRGIGVANEFNSNAQSPIGVYFDEVYQGFRPSHGAALYDLERIEVLKGPQGTLYGRNTTGGAINVISRRPELKGSNGYFTGGYGNYNAYLLQGGIEQTIIPDKLGIRIAFTRTKRNGFIKNAGPENGYPGIAGNRDFQAEDNIAGRVSLRYKPNSDIDITLRGYFAYSDPIGSGGVPYLIGPNQTDPLGYSRANLGPREVIEPGQGKFITKSKGVQARVDWTLGDVVLTSVSGYDKDSFNLSFDFDGSPNSIGQYRDGRSSFYGLNQDVHLSYTSQGLNVIGGLYAGKQQVRTTQDLLYFGFLNNFAGPNQFNPGGLFFTGPGAPPPTAVSTNAGLTQKQTSFAAYAEAKINITSKFNVTIGGRVTKDKVDFVDYYSLLRDSSFNPALYAYTSGQTTPGIGILTGGLSPNLQQKATKPTGRVIFSYDIADRSLVYASYSRGYRSGSYNGSSPVIVPNGVGPELVDAFEAGFKTRFWDNKIQLNGAIFYSKYSGQQVQEVAHGAAFIRSLNGRLYGGELELTAQPVNDLRVVAAVGYLSTRYNDGQFLAPGDPRATDPRGIAIGGNEFPFAPKVTASIAPEWTVLRTANDSKLILSGEAQYQSHQWFDFFNGRQAVGPLRNGQKAYTLVNGRLAWATDRFTVAGFVKNAFNKYYNAYAINTESFGGDFFVPGPPRTYGAELTVRF